MSGMFTTCPGCRMNLAVSAMDLRVGQGYVRCGRCDRVFNALLSLSEDIDPEDQSGHSATGTATVPAMGDETAASATRNTAPAPEHAPEHAPEPAAEPEPPEEQDEEHPDVDVVESTATGTFETIVLEGDGYLQTEELIDEDELDEQLQQIARQIDSSNGNRALEADSEPAPADETDDPEPAAELDADEAVGNRPRAHWAWVAAAVLLALTLAGQLVHHGRHQLVATPWLERPLQQLYGLFGESLEPDWDLAAYDIRQLGGEEMAGTGSAIVLRASVHNQSPNRQPPPMIRAILKDRFGNAISTSEIAPRDYLRGEPPSRMAPDQRMDVELSLEDPNRQAVGYELDTCLPAASGRLHCSNDP